MIKLPISKGADNASTSDLEAPNHANLQPESVALEQKLEDLGEEIDGPEHKRIRISPSKVTMPISTTPDNNDCDTVPRIVDLEIIERQKENIIPLKSGRSATALAELFSTPEKERTTLLEEQRARFEEEISNSSDAADPLEIYQRYVTWTLQSYPQGNSYASRLLLLLERCTREFRNHKRYIDDPRYLRFWLMYAELVSDPLVVYKYLETNNIGQKQAAFYEDYAEQLEKRKMWKEAEIIYKLGINRFAEPLTRIKEKFSLFRVRMFLSGSMPSETDLVMDVSEVMKKKGINNPSLAEQQPIIRQFGRGVLSEQTAPLNHQPTLPVDHGLAKPKNENGKRRLQVYVDQENTPFPTTTEENVAPWDDLGTVASRTRENRGLFDSWHKPLKMGPIPPKKFTKFKVYEDELNSSDEAPKTPRHGIPTRSETDDTPSKTALLKRDPLHYMRSVDVVDKEVKETANAHAKPKSEVAPKPEIIVANLDLLHHDGEERSFEEVRAAFLGLSKKPKSPQSEVEEKEEEKELKNSSPLKRQCSNRHMAPSPTINTKNALKEVLEMFNQPLRHERDCVKSVHTEKEVEVADWEAALISQPKHTKLQVYCDEPDVSEPSEVRQTPPDSSTSKDNVKQENNIYPTTAPSVAEPKAVVYCDKDSAPLPPTTQRCPLRPLYSEENVKKKGKEIAEEELKMAPTHIQRKPGLLVYRDDTGSAERVGMQPQCSDSQDASHIIPPLRLAPIIYNDNDTAIESSTAQSASPNSPDGKEKTANTHSTSFIAQSNHTKLPVSCNETDVALSAPLDPHDGKEGNEDDVTNAYATLPIVQPKYTKLSVYRDEADVAEPATAQQDALHLPLSNDKGVTEEDIAEFWAPPFNIQSKSDLAQLASLDPSLNYANLRGNLSDESNGEISEDDITLQLNLMREQMSSSSTKTLSLHLDDDFTINFSQHNGICSTPYSSYVNNTNTSADQAVSDQYSTPKPLHDHRLPVAHLPVLTPITEASERSTYHTNSYYPSELLPTAQLASLSEQPENSSALDTTLNDDLLTPPFLSQNSIK